MDGLGQIAKAILTASQTVDQRAVQGQTKGVQTRAFSGNGDESEVVMQYNGYKRQMALDGRRPLPFQQWKIINSSTNS